MREMAKERGLSIEEFYSELKGDPELEKSVDSRQEQAMRERDNLIVQGRVAWHFAKKSPAKTFNVFLAVHPQEGARRLAQREENRVKTEEEVRWAAAQRERDEIERYKALYDIDNHLDPKHYNFIIDTTDISPPGVALTIVDAMQKAGVEVEPKTRIA